MRFTDIHRVIEGRRGKGREREEKKKEERRAGSFVLVFENT